jgi:hypothetical protein
MRSGVPESDAPAASTVTSPLEHAPERSFVRQLWGVFRREPVLLVTCSYLFVSFIGLWDSYWFYRRFQIPILEYMQSSDYFVAGLRRPAYLFVLACTLLASGTAMWVERWRRSQPERAARIEQRWWGRLLLPRHSDWWVYFGLHPETMATLAALVMMITAMFTYSTTAARAIHDGAGNAVAVRVDDARGDLPGDWRMLGTSSAFVFLWNAGERRAEVLPIEAVTGIRPLGWRSRRDASAKGGSQGPR